MESFNVLIQHQPKFEDSESIETPREDSVRRKSSRKKKKPIVTPTPDFKPYEASTPSGFDYRHKIE